MSDDKVVDQFLLKIFERTGVWAAQCESSYGGIGFTALFYAWVNSKAKAVSDGTTYTTAYVYADL